MQISLQTEQQQESFGARLSGQFHHYSDGGLVIYLSGDLGAGKTTLVRGMLRGLGWSGAVKSPTYTIMEPYQLADLDLYHFDLYRLADPEELEFLGLRELMGEGILIFEWPEKGLGGLPEPDLVINIQHCEDGRALSLSAHGSKGKRLLDSL